MGGRSFSGSVWRRNFGASKLWRETFADRRDAHTGETHAGVSAWRSWEASPGARFDGSRTSRTSRPRRKRSSCPSGTTRDVESRWRAWSDAEHGGMSSASVSWIPRPEGAEDGDEGAMVLAGTLSTDTVRPLTRLEPAPGATPTIDPWSGAKVTKAVDVGADESQISPPLVPADGSNPDDVKPRVTKSLKRSGFAGCSTKDLPPRRVHRPRRLHRHPLQGQVRRAQIRRVNQDR